MGKSTLVRAKNPHVPGKPMFPPSTEAFCFIIFDNNAAKWAHNIELYKDTNFGAHLPPKKLKEKGKDREPDPHHDAKYTDKDGGQQQFGTFSDAGLEKFEAIRQDITTDRKANRQQHFAFEQKFLAEHLQLPSKKAKDGGKKRKGAGDGPGKSTRRKIIELDVSDDEWDQTAPAAQATAPIAAERPPAAARRTPAAPAANRLSRSAAAAAAAAAAPNKEVPETDDDDDSDDDDDEQNPYSRK